MGTARRVERGEISNYNRYVPHIANRLRALPIMYRFPSQPTESIGLTGQQIGHGETNEHVIATIGVLASQFLGNGLGVSFVIAIAGFVCFGQLAPLRATDHILTIGGGYAPEGNQASLEANVIFFQSLLTTKHRSPLTHRIQFADGFDPSADLQILVKAPAASSPAIALLTEIFAPPGPPGVVPGSQRIGYRNHRVPNISGSNRLTDVRTAMDVVGDQLRKGDRLIIYVTAHGGSPKKGSGPFETSITCWGNRDLNMSDLALWLDGLPADVPVVLVMAQCYCGGFAQTVFSAGDHQAGISRNIRTGFFAQRHDLPAAGCRPDVDDDEEYSSYFWGALLGKTRSGKPTPGVDINSDNKISLGEAHAFAMIASETIDIPLRGSDALLRKYSRIPDYEIEGYQFDDEGTDSGDSDGNSDGDNKSTDKDADTFGNEATASPRVQLAEITGSLAQWAEKANPIDRTIILELSKRMDLDLKADVTKVFKEYSDALREMRAARRGGFGRRGRSGFSRRRELRDALIEKYPELEDQDNWKNLGMLQGDQGAGLIKEIEQMPAHIAYQSSREDRQKARGASFDAEMRQVRLRRLIHTLESVVLAENLPRLAPDNIVERYLDLLKLENSLFE